jgi:uncharacterized coiled-coil protein SlyX
MQKKSQEDVLERISDAIAESITVKTKMLDNIHNSWCIQNKSYAEIRIYLMETPPTPSY